MSEQRLPSKPTDDFPMADDLFARAEALAKVLPDRAAQAKDMPADILQNMEELHPEVLTGPPEPS